VEKADVVPARSTPTVHVAFVRAVMHGRAGLHRSVLIDCFEGAGAAEVQTYLTTGNVSFAARPAAVRGIARKAEAAIGEVVGRPTEVFVRTVDELLALQALDPFRVAPLTVEHERIVAFLDHEPAVTLPIWSPSRDFVVFGTGPRELFSVAVRYPDGTSRGSGGLVERATGTRVTSRAWSTVERILAKVT
jgi:uncharacterized protein (DUF1697 family)